MTVISQTTNLRADVNPMAKKDGEFDVSIPKALNAIAGGLIETVELGVGNGVTALVMTPRALVDTYRAIFKFKEMGPVLKGTAVIGATLGALLTPPLVVAGSALTGLFVGMGTGYQEGVIKAAKDGVKTVENFWKMTNGFLNEVEKWLSTDDLGDDLGQFPHFPTKPENPAPEPTK